MSRFDISMKFIIWKKLFVAVLTFQNKLTDNLCWYFHRFRNLHKFYYIDCFVFIIRFFWSFFLIQISIFLIIFVIVFIIFFFFELIWFFYRFFVSFVVFKVDSLTAPFKLSLRISVWFLIISWLMLRLFAIWLFVFVYIKSIFFCWKKHNRFLIELLLWCYFCLSLKIEILKICLKIKKKFLKFFLRLFDTYW